MPWDRMDVVNSCNAAWSIVCRGCKGSGWIRSILMKNAPGKEDRASHSGGTVPPSSNCSNGCFLENARSADRFAAAIPFEAGLDFVKEFAGDAGSPASGSVNGNGDTVGDGTFKGCQIRDDGVKSQSAVMLA